MKTDILILGAGIGGYETFRTLQKQLKKYHLKKTITLVDKHNYFTFTPMHHEAASGSIEPDHCAFSLRELVSGTPHQFFKAKVNKIHPDKHIVETNRGNISYEYCVVALGSRVNFFDTPGAAEFTHHVRDLPSATRLQETFISILENCQKEFNLIVVGGGPTGVEIAGQFAYFARKDIKRLYPMVKVNIKLIESGDRLLARLHPSMGKLAEKKLKQYGVDIRTKYRVKEVSKDTIVTETNEKKGIIPATLVIWTAGFENIAEEILDKKFAMNCRIPVSHHLNHSMAESLYAVGDIAHACNPGETESHPQLGETAHHQGKYVGKHIVATMRKKKIRPFMFRSAGTLMPIGDWYAIGRIGNVTFSGRFAWWLRRTVYLMFIPGLVRKIRVVSDWTLHSLSGRYMIDIEDGEDRKILP